jgi:ABC-type nitrate/sulfonate/bicarbonate transport system ATPase subunit
MEPLISLSGVSFHYPVGSKDCAQLPVLKNISVTTRPGELLAIVGPSGCGKTTLLNIIAGLLLPDAGTIDIPDLIGGRPRRSAYVFQSPRLVPWLSVRENALFGAELSGVLTSDVQNRCSDRLETYGLKGFEDSLPHMLSGGMQQRVSLLRALLSGAKVLLLDEPYVNSDFILRRQLQAELSDAIARDKLVGILVTHELIQAARLADEIVILSERPAEVVDSFRIPIDRNDRLNGKPSALRDLAEYTTRLEHAVSRSRKARN